MPHEREPAEYIQRRFDFDEGMPPEENVNLRRVRESFAPYIDLAALRHYSASGADLRVALRYAPELLPEEVVQIVETLKLLLTPVTREQVKSPVDIAALLMLDMGYLQQEQFKVACLDTRNRLQKLHMCIREA
jgi:hypothetical protein